MTTQNRETDSGEKPVPQQAGLRDGLESRPDDIKIELNHPCKICNSKLMLGEGTIIRGTPVHFVCYEQGIKKKVYAEILSEFEEYLSQLRKVDTYSGDIDVTDSELDYCLNNMECLRDIIKKKFMGEVKDEGDGK